MKHIHLSIALVLCRFTAAGAAEPLTSTVTGLKNPASACYGPGGFLYVTEIGKPEKDGDGKIAVIQKNKSQPFATGLDDPKGIIYYRDALYVTDKTKIVKVDAQGKTSIYAKPEAFPAPPIALHDLALDGGNGIFLVSDAGKDGKGGAVYRIDFRLSEIKTVADADTTGKPINPTGVAFDGAAHLIFADSTQGTLVRVRVADKSATTIAKNIEGADGLVWDQFGRLFIMSGTTGKTFVIPRPGTKPIQIDAGLKSPADGCLESTGQNLLICDSKSGTVATRSTKIPGWEINDAPLPVECQLAFPKLQWTGWDDGSESGKISELRPLLLTHAGDGSNQIFVVMQDGLFHAFENDDQVTKTKIFLDLTDRVSWDDKRNEEGLLGLAFHPKFKQNGELFVYYTDKKSELTNVLSRFRLNKNDRTTADPGSEEQLLRIKKPYPNHNGGTITFGPDGYLYFTHGDGGSGGDPQKNGQNLKNVLGKILRIDVDHKSAGKPYAIPSDNPFAKQSDAAPEIWAYGLRNVWRMAFDRKTGQLWAADVGQGEFEEINRIQPGGNYGWSLREGLHPFSEKGVDANPDMIDPVWEYHHSLGVSITGGLVYRGSAIPELNGAYLYGDYVSNRMWALRYDPRKVRVVANQPIKGPGVPLMSFGEDNRGEVYVMGATVHGRGIFRLGKSAAKAP